MKKRLFAALMVMVVAVSMPVYGASKDEDSSSDVIKVRVAGTADYEPYTYVDEDDNITGYDIEVIKAIDELAPEIECEYSYTQWDTLLPGLDADKFDVVSNQFRINNFITILPVHSLNLRLTDFRHDSLFQFGTREIDFFVFLILAQSCSLLNDVMK